MEMTSVVRRLNIKNTKVVPEQLGKDFIEGTTLNWPAGGSIFDKKRLQELYTLHASFYTHMVRGWAICTLFFYEFFFCYLSVNLDLAKFVLRI